MVQNKNGQKGNGDKPQNQAQDADADYYFNDYYFNDAGLMVFTASYLKRRGYCCKNGCKHCPYGFKKS